MKTALILVLFGLLHLSGRPAGVIRINQLGYLPPSVKVAVFFSDGETLPAQFQVYETLTGKLIFEGQTEEADASVWGMKSACRLNFTSLQRPGGYWIKAGDAVSPSFRIADDIYDGTADFVLRYMRQQRCGFNPFLNDSCHVHDGIIVDHPTRSGEQIDVTGGWHDASDYLQYTTTSANAIYQMLFAYRHNPAAFGDHYDAAGRPGANGIPDILDEVRWGLDWLLKMNPAPNEMYNQIADDRDHQGLRLPNNDNASYGLGKARPVYFVTGKPLGLSKHKNRTTGVASTAAKFASSFALASEVFSEADPTFAARLQNKALEAWQFAKSDLGVCQTACMVSPYFYEEDNYIDDMELAAASLMQITPTDEFLKEARYWGELEPVTPWMELHRARHYQYYPFINLGHALLAQSDDPVVAEKFKALLKQGLEQLKKYAGQDPFSIGVPFIWCSNNLVVAAATQARLYRQISGDRSFETMEAALTDWLFGCNPWGTSMICGLPAGGDFPETPHSSITYLMKQTTTGGLVDGPVYQHIYQNLIGIHLLDADEYAPFQNGKAVYHDDLGDYSTNEPTMDGTASLSFLLSSLETGSKKSRPAPVITDSQGATIRLNPQEKKVYLVFSAHEYADGGQTIAETLRKNRIKASFFLTGDFYRNPENRELIARLIRDGHYLGAHSDRHLLYADWSRRDSSRVDRQLFTDDLTDNYAAMQAFGIAAENAPVFLPPYEWYNAQQADWSRQLGLTLINFTPGIRSNADYTTPDMANYRSSETILKDIKTFEKSDPNGLNGCIILIHLGTAPQRTDKFYNRLGELLRFLKQQGYRAERF